MGVDSLTVAHRPAMISAWAPTQHLRTITRCVRPAGEAAVRYCSLGQISDAFFEIGGQYRHNV